MQKVARAWRCSASGLHAIAHASFGSYDALEREIATLLRTQVDRWVEAERAQCIILTGAVIDIQRRGLPNGWLCDLTCVDTLVRVRDQLANVAAALKSAGVG